MIVYTLAYALLVYAWQCTGQDDTVEVNTTLGAVRGRVITLIDDFHPGFEVNTFYNLPFSKPPIGDLRFAPPEFPEPWDGVLDVTERGFWCLQSLSEGYESKHMNYVPGARDGPNEDCLNMNIFAPADQSGAPYPVMMWIYGGGYQAGSNLGYLGHFHAAQGVVMVIPNYRLGIFGFAFSGDEAIPGNIGLMDQILALQFIQDNIAAFGGDPNMVTIAGQSAGGTAVGSLVLSPWAAGLFHQAIPQSGCGLTQWGYNGPDHQPENYTFQVALDVGCPIEDTAEMVECMRQVPGPVLNGANFECKDGYMCMGHIPVVDGEGGVIPDRPHAMRNSSNFNKVNEIIGLTRNDGHAFICNLGPEVCTPQGPSYEQMQTVIRRTVDIFVPRGISEERADDLYEALMFYIMDWPHLDDGYTNRDQLGVHGTDGSYGYCADMEARSQSQFADVWFYIFDYIPPNYPPNDWMGCTHSGEIPFVFGYPFIRHNPDVREQVGLEDAYPWTEEDDEWAYFMIKLWTNFAKYGDPTPDPVETPGDIDPFYWESYDTEDFAYGVMSREEMGTHYAYRQHGYAFFREYLPYVVAKHDLPELAPPTPRH